MCEVFFLCVNYNILFLSNMANSNESAIRLTSAIKSRSMSVVRALVEIRHLDCHAVFQHPENVDRATFLHMAVKSRRKDVVKYLIEERGVNVDQRLADGKTSLHLAAIGGCFEIAKLLVKIGADCNAVDKMSCSPCLYAAALGRAEIIEFLVKHGKADINKRTEGRGTSPFHIAAERINDSRFLKLLIDLGADFSARDVKGYSALHYAVKYGHVSTIKFLIEENHLDPNQRDKDGRNFLHFVLLSHGETEAVTKGQAEIVEYLVKAGKVDVDEVMDEGVTILHVACTLNRDLNIVKLLIDGGADCNARDNAGDSPLHQAVLFGKMDAVQYLIAETNADVNGRNLEGLTPLHFACKSGKLVSVKLLLDNGADISLVDNLGRCCLHFGTIRDSADIVKYLVEEKKFDVNRGTTNEAFTSLHLAASSGHLELCKLLVELGADYALRDLEGNFALHFAAMEGHVDILKYFLNELGQDANKCINKVGASPFHLACEKDHLACVKFLLENGADYELLDIEGRDCVGLAALALDLNVFRFLWEKIIK